MTDHEVEHLIVVVLMESLRGAFSDLTDPRVRQVGCTGSSRGKDGVFRATLFNKEGKTALMEFQKADLDNAHSPEQFINLVKPQLNAALDKLVTLREVPA